MEQRAEGTCQFGGEDVVAYIEYDIGDSSRITELLIALDVS